MIYRLILTLIFFFNIIIINLKALNNQNIHLKIGWNLKGTYLDNVSLEYFENNSIKTIWKWDNNKWLIWSPDQNIMNLIYVYLGENKIKGLNSGEGFWINSTKDFNISFLGKISDKKLIIPNSGWFLVSSKININDKFTIFKELPIKTIWKWDNSSWSIWTKYSSIITLIKSYGINWAENFTAEDGFWIYAESGFSYNFSKCSKNNLSECYTEEDCISNGGYWNDNKCLNPKIPINIYIFDDNFNLLKGSVLEDLKSKNYIFSSKGIISLTDYSKSSKYLIKKAGYDNCTINISDINKKNECYISDGDNYVVFLHNNLTDNKTLGFPIPYIEEFSPKELLQSLLIPATPVKIPILSLKKDALLILNKINTKKDYTISVESISNPNVGNYFTKGIPLYLFRIRIEDSNQNVINNIDGSLEVKPIIKVFSNNKNFENIFLYQRNSKGEWKYVCPVIFKNNMLIPLLFVENLSEFLFVKFSDNELLKIEGKVKDIYENPIENTVIIANNSIVTFSDKQGFFSIKTPEIINSLTICKKDFICTKIDNNNTNNIILKKDKHITNNIKIDFYGITNKAVFSNPQLFGNKIIFSTIFGNIYVLENQQLEKEFNKFDGYLYNEFNKLNENFIIGTTLRGNMKIFNVKTKKQNYNISLNEELFFGEENYYFNNIITFKNYIFVPLYNEDNNFSKLIKFEFLSEESDLSLSKVSNNFSGRIGRLNKISDIIAFGDDNGVIRFIDSDKFKLKKSIENKTKITSKVIQFGNYYVAGDWNGNIIVIDKNFNKVNSINIGNLKIYNLSLINNSKLALSTNNGVYIIDKNFEILNHYSNKIVSGDIYCDKNNNWIFVTIDGYVYKNNKVIINIGNKITFYIVIDDKLFIGTNMGEIIELNLNSF